MEVVKINLEGTTSAPITFRCTCCEIVLRVRQGVSQTTGPCPVCGTINSCSGLGEPPESRVVVTAAEMPKQAPPVSFIPKQRILPPVELDESWKKRQAKGTRQFKRRKKLEELTMLFETPLASKLKMVAIALGALLVLGAISLMIINRMSPN